jgi:hypothetical protein
MAGREWHGRGWSYLEYCVKTGKQAVDKIYGMPIFDFFTKNPEEAKIFDDAMTGLSSIDGPPWPMLTTLMESTPLWMWRAGADFCWRPYWRRTPT